MRRLPLICVAAFLTSSAWATTYTFTGINYDTLGNFSSCTAGSCMNFTTSMKPSGSFTVATPLGANLSLSNIASQLTAYSFSDGITTYTNSDLKSRVFEFEVSTDASGNITVTRIELQEWQLAGTTHSSGDRYAYMELGTFELVLNNDVCALVGASPFSGVSDSCTADAPDSSTSFADNVQTGTWMTVVPTPTLGEWETIFLGGLLVTIALLRLRRQEPSSKAA